LLEVDAIDVYYDDIKVLDSVTLRLNEGEVLSIVGSNAAGKSTLLRAISGLKKPRKGMIKFLGERIENLPPHIIVQKGIMQVPEGRRLFPTLTVLENLQLGSYTEKAKAQRKQTLQKVYELFRILEERKDQKATTLSGGEQQMLAIARALMGLPKLLSLDEPSLGLGPKVVETIFSVIEQIRREGTTILLVEQNVMLSLKICNRGYVLENGRIVMQGNGEALLADDGVRKAYLG
jgi:branched-chain amino acid transport system ATP-binding protein